MRKEITPMSLRDRNKQHELAILMNDGVVVELKADVFIRMSNKRKPKEPWDAYKRGMRNQSKALKARLKFGPNASLLINKETMRVY